MIEYLMLLAGIFLLIKGADFLVEGSSSLAKKLGVSSLVIGLTIVAFGTSMPELIVNVISAINGASEVAFGNIIGSNISNTLLILGICALITPLAVHKSTTWKEIPFSLMAVLILIVFANTQALDNFEISKLLRAEGVILVLFFIIFLFYTFELTKRKQTETKSEEEQFKNRSGLKIFLLISLGLAALYFGGKWTVDSAVTIAKNFGLSEFLISSTIIAIGTSLPELITSIIAVRKKNIDLAVGSVVGSNIFNIFWVLGFTAIIKPISFPSFISIDLLILLVAAALLFIFMFVGEKHRLKKWQGGVFVFLYAIYLIIIIYRG